MTHLREISYQAVLSDINKSDMSLAHSHYADVIKDIFLEHSRIVWEIREAS